VILLWGLEHEGPLASVRAALDDLNVPFEMLDQRDVLETEVRLEVDGHIRGRVRTPHQRIDLAAVTAVYARPYATERLPVVRRPGPESPAWSHAHRVERALWSWAEITPALVVSRPLAMASNNSKPYQAQRIRRHGFAVPDTLVTTDPAAARAFWQRHGEIIYKSASGTRSRVARLRPEDEPRLQDVAWCPTQFQEYVPGREHRVHVVGGEVFACEVLSEADDYRYAPASEVALGSCDLPIDVADRCRDLAAALSLPVAGIDLRLTPRGIWYCFEVNPMPAFSCYESATDRPISAAVARLLAEPGVGRIT
jgi:hypothetical protein